MLAGNRNGHLPNMRIWDLNRLYALFSLFNLLIRFSSEGFRASPTKKYKRSAPGSPEFESQPAVVVTYVTSCLLQFTNDVFEVQNMVTDLSGAS